MSSLKALPPCPDNLKPMLHYLKASGEHDSRDPVVAYWLRFHAVQLGIRIDSKTKPAKAFISGVMDNLESTKKNLKTNEAVTTDIVAQAHIENYAVKLFNWADAQDRASHFDKNVVKAFYTAGLLFDVLSIWGELNEEVARQQKYAKWKAAYIHNCLKNGETPVPGPLESEQDQGFDEISAPPANLHHASFGGENDINTSTFDKPFLPPGGPSHTYNDQPSYSDPNSNKPPASLPVAPPRNMHVVPQPQPNATPSPSMERRAAFAISPTGVSLSPDDILKAQKYCKYAGSALQFDDLATATDLLEKTLRLLKTGRED